MSTPPDERDTPTLFGDAGPYILLGWQIALGFIVFAGIGYGLDLLLDTLPWFLLAGIGFGIVSIFFQIYRLNADLQARDQRRRARSGPPKYKTWEDKPDDWDRDDWDRDDWKQDDWDNDTSDQRPATSDE